MGKEPVLLAAVVQVLAALASLLLPHVSVGILAAVNAAVAAVLALFVRQQVTPWPAVPSAASVEAADLAHLVAAAIAKNEGVAKP